MTNMNKMSPHVIVLLAFMAVVDVLILVGTDKVCPTVSYSRIILALLIQAILLVISVKAKAIWQVLKTHRGLMETVIMIIVIAFLSSFLTLWIGKQGLYGDKFNRSCEPQGILSF